MQLPFKVERPPGLNRDEWLAKLALISTNLGKQNAKANLVLIGGATGIFAGQPARTSIDIDVWKPRSTYQYAQLKQAVEDAGLLFDPKGVLEPDKPYVQMIEPGLCQTGKFEKTEPLENFGALTTERPPIANLIAGKLVRGEPRDIEDIAYLMATFRPDRASIEKAVKSMPFEAMDKARENLVYLDVISANTPGIA